MTQRGYTRPARSLTPVGAACLSAAVYTALARCVFGLTP